MATIKFYANVLDPVTSLLIPHELGSGLGFYGPGYGTSVPIANTQNTTWLTNQDGTSSEQIQLNNTKYHNASQVSVNGAAPINLQNLPNALCPLRIDFEHDEIVRVQNTKLRIFDRNNIANHASGVSTFVFEARHPSIDQNKSNLNHRVRTTNEWLEFDPASGGSPTDMPLTSSPGSDGTNGSNNDTSDLGALTFLGAEHEYTRHSWYLALSVEPHTIGSKLFGLYFSTEYL